MNDMNFGGGFVWALDLDDFDGQFCGEGKYPLMSHLRKLIDSSQSSYKIIHQCLNVTDVQYVFDVLSFFLLFEACLQIPPLHTQQPPHLSVIRAH